MSKFSHLVSALREAANLFETMDRLSAPAPPAAPVPAARVAPHTNGKAAPRMPRKMSELLSKPEVRAAVIRVLETKRGSGVGMSGHAIQRAIGANVTAAQVKAVIKDLETENLALRMGERSQTRYHLV